MAKAANERAEELSIKIARSLGPHNTGTREYFHPVRWF